MKQQAEETGCCPRFDPEPWDRQEVTWQDKLFVRDQVRSFLHMPLNFGRVMVRNMRAIDEANVRDPRVIVLSRERSLWGADLYFAVSGEVPGARMERMSGTFLTRVFEGPYRDAGKWVKEMASYVGSRGREMKELYLWYTTCPKCARAYGKNYVVLFAEV